MTRDRLGQLMSLLDAYPSMGKRPRPPKDILWQINRSRPEVRGMVASSNPGIPTGWTLDAAACKYPGSHVCPPAQGEGVTVALTLGTRVAEATHATQSRGAAPLAMCTSPQALGARGSPSCSRCTHLSPP